MRHKASSRKHHQPKIFFFESEEKISAWQGLRGDVDAAEDEGVSLWFVWFGVGDDDLV
jgi:hypothetical protein